MNESRELPGSPVVRTLCFPCWGPGAIPSRGTKIPRDTEHGPKKKNGKKMNEPKDISPQITKQ